MMLSPFNPILFHDRSVNDSFSQGYTHVYAPNDHIGFEIFHTEDETLEPLKLLDGDCNVIMDLTWNKYAINSHSTVSFYEFEGLDTGYYHLSFGSWISNLIYVTNDNLLLDKTVLLQYSLTSNTTRNDVLPIINGRIRYFETRLPGGFKDSGWIFSVENEQYFTKDSDIVELYSIEATDKELTIGESEGLPICTGVILNHIFACGLIFIDGKRYSVSNENTIDSEPVNERGDRFVYSISLRMVRAINASFERQLRSIFRKTPTHIRRVGRSLRKI